MCPGISTNRGASVFLLDIARSGMFRGNDGRAAAFPTRAGKSTVCLGSIDIALSLKSLHLKSRSEVRDCCA